jgi:hypothetical protein
MISESDIVIGYGRNCYEAMAMGKPCIVFGVHGGDGYVTHNNFLQLFETNLTGFSIQKIPEPENLVDWSILTRELLQYSAKDGDMLHEIAKKYLDIKLYVDTILES